MNTGLTKTISRLSRVAVLQLVWAFASLFGINVYAQDAPPRPKTENSAVAIGKGVMLRIVRAEDERRWENDLQVLLSDANAAVRSRATLAAGRIGDERAVTALISLLQEDKDDSVRAMAAFALGEIESALASDALIVELQRGNSANLRGRAVEALGKIAAALPKTEEASSKKVGQAILSVLEFEAKRRSRPETRVILPGLTAALRARPENAGKVIVEFLSYSDPRIREDAANALARLRVKEGNEQLRKLLTGDSDAIVRANAARVLGATEDNIAFDSLLDRALQDNDARVRVSAIRALAALKDARAAQPLLKSSARWNLTSLRTRPGESNEALEIATTLGRLLQGTENKEALAWLARARESLNHSAPEMEIAFARISPNAYLTELGRGSEAKRNAQAALLLNWRGGSSIAQALGEFASLPDAQKGKSAFAAEAQEILRAMLAYRNAGMSINTLVAGHSEYGIPDVLNALAAFKSNDLGELLHEQLKESDVIVRATAAELLGDRPPSESNARALAAALRQTAKDDLNDAALALLDALAKQKSTSANESIKAALDSSDYLIRRRAVTLLKTNGAGDFSSRIGNVRSRNTIADYERAIKRMGKHVRAVVSTSRGSFTIELLPDDAPLNVDNFVQLAKRGYFGGIAFHRVVPNFVIQGGDPRGDGNGGPGYQIRCEINEVPYDRSAVGMALSGKDTGGSQWFVTHSPQPHLDGGYTVFGKVIDGMDVVDQITRGDVIRSVVITQKSARSSR
jgi:cyclophilin family peptidyl-prolyl cis-trans isomerase/HEAT repeat protein